MDGSTLESAEAVCHADLDTLASLVDKSLVRRRAGRVDEERFWMLETIREYAMEHLGRLPGLDDLRSRHALRMLAIVRGAHLSDDYEPLLQRHEIVLAEREDIRRALDWSLDGDPTLGIELCVALESYLAAADPADGARRLGELLERAESLPSALEAAAHRAYGGALYRHGDFERGTREHERSRDLFLALGDKRGATNLETRLAINAAHFGELDEARRVVERAVQLARSLEMPRLEAESLGALATLARREGRLDDAFRLEGKSAEQAEACGFVWWQANALANRMELALELGNLHEAEVNGREALRFARTMDDRLATLWVLVCFAMLGLRRDQLDRAGRVWGTVASEVVRHPPPQLALLEELSAPLRALADPVFLAAVQQGSEGDLDDAIALALEEGQTEP